MPHQTVRIITILLAVLATSPAPAARGIIPPQFSWHDWYYITVVPAVPPSTTWTPQPVLPTGPGGLQRCIDIAITNQSTTGNQTVTVIARTVPSAFGTASAANPSVTLSMDVTMDTVSYAPVGTTPQTFTWGPNAIAPKATRVATFCGAYNRNPFRCDYYGDWHMAGAFDLEITIQEDRGAVAAVLNSRMENSGCSIDMNSGVSAMRNVGKTLPINGGRPF